MNNLKRDLPPFLNSSGQDEPIHRKGQLPPVVDTENLGTFGITKGNERALCLKVEFRNGLIGMFPYSRMGTPLFFDGEKNITLPTGTGTLQIIGENVSQLLDFLAYQKLAWIREALREDTMLAEGGDIIIETIIYNARD